MKRNLEVKEMTEPVVKEVTAATPFAIFENGRLARLFNSQAEADAELVNLQNFDEFQERLRKFVADFAGEKDLGEFEVWQMAVDICDYEEHMS